MLAVVYLRAPAGNVTGEFYASNSNNISLWQPDIGAEWQRYYCPIEYASGSGQNVQFWLGFDQQTVDVGGFALLNFGQNAAYGDLPRGPQGTFVDPYYDHLTDDLSEMGLPSGEFVYGTSETAARNTFYETAGDFGSVSSIDVAAEGAPFAEARAYEITSSPANPWDVQLYATLPRAVSAGDVMLGVAYLRSPSDSPIAEFHAVDSNDSGNHNQGPTSPTISSEWTRYYFPIEFGTDSDADNAYVQFQLGFQQQTVEVGGVALIDFGQDADVNSLPSGVPGSGGGEDITEWPAVDDQYYSTLVDDLSAMELSPGKFVYANNEADTFAAYDVDMGEYGDKTRPLDVSGDGVPFSEAARFDVTQNPSNDYAISFKGEVPEQAISSGDVLLGVAYLRTPNNSRADVTYKTGYSADSSADFTVKNNPSVGQQWKRYYFPIEAGDASDPTAEGESWWTEFWLGADVQTVDIGGLALLYFSQDLSTSDLPVWEDERNENWEANADARIDSIRTTDFSVDVVDGDGNAVSDADVQVAMHEHEFDFGTALDAAHLVENTESGDTFREKIPHLFNTVVLENAHKWRFWEEEKYTADYGTQWAIENGLDVRGHVALWGDVSNWAVPMDVVRAMGVEFEDGNVTDPELDPEYVEERTHEHLEEIIQYYGDYIDDWEVANEHIHKPGLLAAIDGKDVDDAGLLETPDGDHAYLTADTLASWYQTARDAAPEGTSLAVNDYSVLTGNYGGKQTKYESQIEFLANQDAGLDIAGMQSHFSDESTTLSPVRLMETFNQYAQYDVDLRISELDMTDGDWSDEDKGTYFYQFLKMAFSHEAVAEFDVWGINDAYHWRDDAPFFDAEWNPKPALAKYKDLVFNQWWTNETGATDGEGSLAVSGAFKGEYAIIVTVDDEETTKYATVSDDTGTVEVDVSTSYEPPEEPDVDLMDAYRSSSDDDDDHDDSRSSSDSTATPTASPTPTATSTATEESTATPSPTPGGAPPAQETDESTATEVTDESGPGMGVASAVAGLIGVGRYLTRSTSEEEEN
ncbi:endo-1,4-beta-xylanase [Halomicrobium zhouii]|nr:endo-1,4-beta-xylanase [Halomicrobium zhouii]